MIKRKLFFLFEKLQITRSERIAVTVLLMSLVGLSSVALISEPTLNDNAEYYEELERIFAERSTQVENEREEILARYEPVSNSDITQSEESEVEDQLLENSVEESVLLDSLVINVNTADSEELQKLPGIGPAYSERIIEWREENGDFTNLDQLLEIRGIGEKRLADMLPHIILKEENDAMPD